MKHRPIIIALTGPDGVGKSTVGRLLSRHFDHYGSDVLSYAAPVRIMAGGIVRDVFGWDGKREPPKDHMFPGGATYRDVLRSVGTHVRGAIGESILEMVVDAELLSRHSERAGRTTPSIIDDLRTAGEAMQVHSWTGVVIELRRDGIDYSGHDLDQRLPPTLIDASIPLLSDPQEAAAHILRLTGWVE